MAISKSLFGDFTVIERAAEATQVCSKLAVPQFQGQEEPFSVSERIVSQKASKQERERKKDRGSQTGSK